MHFTIHQPVKTTKQVNRVVSLPADISLAWFLARTESLASRTLAEVAMQAKIYHRIFLGRRGKFRGRASTLRVPLARLTPEILTSTHHAGTYVRKCASDANDSTQCDKKRERNVHQQEFKTKNKRLLAVCLMQSGIKNLLSIINFSCRQTTTSSIFYIVFNVPFAVKRN